MEILLILILIFINGIFAMAEMALISSKKSRIKKRELNKKLLFFHLDLAEIMTAQKLMY